MLTGEAAIHMRLCMHACGGLSKLWCPFGSLNTRCRIILRTQKGTIILTTIHVCMYCMNVCTHVCIHIQEYVFSEKAALLPYCSMTDPLKTRNSIHGAWGPQRKRNRRKLGTSLSFELAMTVEVSTGVPERKTAVYNAWRCLKAQSRPLPRMGRPCPYAQSRYTHMYM